MKITLVKIEDREGQGECGQCGRHGLRWIAVLSDGSAVGLECAKKVMGHRPAPAKYQWVEHYTAIAEHRGVDTVYVLWQHKSGRETRETRNGHLMTVGGARKDWQERGWL